MYEELVKALRCKGLHYEDCEKQECKYIKNGWCDYYRLNIEAADAIDELDTLLDGVSADNDALCETIERLKKPRWIPVTERLPKKFKDVLTYGKYGIMIDKYIGQFCGEDSFALALRNVTHWMPLPEPPKEET